jgi:hypothetical protein
MKKATESVNQCCSEKFNFVKHHHHHHGGHSGSPIYCLGVAGALFYFLQNVSGFGAVMLGIGKAFVWPALLMFKLLAYLQM